MNVTIREDMLDDVLAEWAVRIWVEPGVIISAIWIGYNPAHGLVDVTAWSEKDQDYNKPVQIDPDSIRKIEIW